MIRRSILQALGGGTLLSLAVGVGADEKKEPSAGTDHAAHHGKYAELVGETSHCIATGDACLTHCLNLLGQGDKELAGCARTVRDMIAACTALRELAAAESGHVKALASVVAGICADCVAECRKHEEHPVCRDCGRACHDCKEICDRVSAAA